MAAGAAISAIENIASVTNLIAKLIMSASCFPVWRAIPPAARIKPRFAKDIPEEIRLPEDDRDGSNGAASRMFTNMVTGRMPGCLRGNALARLEFLGVATNMTKYKYRVQHVDRCYAGGSEHGRRANPTRRTGSRAGYCGR